MHSKRDHNVNPSKTLSCDTTTPDNERLTCMATDEEITHEVHQISPLKALGPDGVHALFLINVGIFLGEMCVV